MGEHRCLFWLFWSKNRCWFTWWFFSSTREAHLFALKGHLCGRAATLTPQLLRPRPWLSAESLRPGVFAGGLSAGRWPRPRAWARRRLGGLAAVTYLWVKTNGTFLGLGEFTTHFSPDFGGDWEVTRGTIWIFTHGHLDRRKP